MTSDATTLDASERKKKYKRTLNLPKTAFPMRANLAQNEPQSRRSWEKDDLYARILAARHGDEPFVFHDGPPYANGSIHVGHLLNKVLKDLVVRSRLMSGRFCHFVPGWDCHGLPIEHRVVSEMVESGKIAKLESLGKEQRRVVIRRECRRYAEKYQRLQAEQMKRLLTLADYGDPYLTMTPTYEREVLEVLARLVEEGLVYRDLKPVHWSISNQTALAEAELEYREREDPSVYVGFEATDAARVAAAFGVETPAEAPALLIWTTTPWTLPANLLIAVGPEFRYVLARLGERLLIVARERLETVAALVGEPARVLAEARGEDLVGLTYEHPLLERRGRVVAAEHVTLDDGTGLVHTAPGHGEEDYLLGMREGTEIYSPVRGDGTFDDSVPEWLRGRLVWDANGEIIERLRRSGHLLAAESYLHPYPHDWRSKTPVIFRCTEQWFVAVDEAAASRDASLRAMALAACEEKIRFVPEWGQKRLRGMLESRPDWCISRQRSWGLPIPAFRDASGNVLLTPASVRAVAEAFGREGSDAWFTREPAELLADYDPAGDPDAPPGLEIDGVEKMYDILDVWFESGSSWNAVLRQRRIGYPADLYLEGSDQHRGWFQLSLLPALGATGEPPFRQLLTHGFVVDREGKKMSKSLGNTLEVEDLLGRYGTDVCRWWVSSLAYESDIRVDLEFFDAAGDSYRKIRNTLRFLLSNLQDFDPEAAPALEKIDPVSIDAYALERAGELGVRVEKAYERYEFRRAHLLLYNFCNDTLSSLYLDAVKDRLYCDRPDSARRRRTQGAIHRIADLLCCLLAPILPHTAEEAHRALHGEGAGSVHLRTFPRLTARADPGWARVLETREAVLKRLEKAKSEGIENPLDAGLTLPDRDGVLARFEADLADALGVSRVELRAEGGEIEVRDLRGEPRCERSWRRDATVRLRSDGGLLSDRDAEAAGVA